VEDDEIGALPPRTAQTLPTNTTATIQPSTTPNTNTMAFDWIGDVAGAIEGMSGQFNSDFQDSQVQIAQAQADAARANAEASKNTESKPNYLLYGGIALVVVVVLVIISKSKKPD
jgi:hypothetical protein